VAAAAGLAVVGILEREKLVERAASMGERLGQSLKERLMGNSHVGDVRGVGMIWGVELVADKKTLKPFARKEQVAERVWQELFDNGVVVYRGVGLAGIDGDAFLVAPPFIITEQEMDLAVEKIGQAIERVLG
jgi:adenosylmethionine-8-amino-7-oxononanoate aminotransferase